MRNFVGDYRVESSSSSSSAVTVLIISASVKISFRAKQLSASAAHWMASVLDIGITENVRKKQLAISQLDILNNILIHWLDQRRMRDYIILHGPSGLPRVPG
ncbi:hypothetical protein AVEN_69012-1 [Araneus ventricosus]|uniref:Uncharacterized protein n=1 Tax=Araneus ventricosus TaxID=182803 RepID=A0A4Y2QP31_ARAVE|nr:hypothetical protein AVEN_69012-1 [Araneus ventricosus]